MKKIVCIIICAILLSAFFVCVRTTVMPVLMRGANYGTNSLIAIGEVNKLFIGSSMFRQGIDAQAISIEEGDSFLLSYNGNQPFMIKYQLEKLINNGVKIKTVFLDMYAYSLTAEPSLSDVRVLQENNLDFAFSMYETMKESGTADFSDLYEMVLKSNNEMFITWPVSHPLINSRYVYGSNSTKNVGGTEGKLKNLPLKFGNKELNDIQVESLEKIINLCRENKINIVFLETPKYTYLYEGGNYCEIMTEYTNLLNKYGVKQIISQNTAEVCGFAENDNCILYSFDSNNPSYFTDLLHMSSDGREVFTEIFKEIVTT